MSKCQTLPRLEKRPGAFCFLWSEKRSANRTGSLKGTEPRTRNLESGILVRVFLSVLSWYAEASFFWCPGMSCKGNYGPGYGSYVCLLVPLLYSRFHGDRSLWSTLRRLVSRAVAAAVSASISSTSLRQHFSVLLRHSKVRSTFLFRDLSRSLDGRDEKMAKGVVAA